VILKGNNYKTGSRNSTDSPFHAAMKLKRPGCRLANIGASGKRSAQMKWKKLLLNRRFQLLGFVLLLLGMAVCISAWRVGISLDDLKDWWRALTDFLRESPIWLFVALVILPGFPVPTSALLFVAGMVWREHPVAACAIQLVAMMINLSWTYWLAGGFGRRWAERMFGALGIKIPELQGSSHLRMVLVLKLTPGIPFFVQNYLCGFLQVPFRLYLLVSLVCNGIIGTGIVLAGVGFGDGKLVPALTGISLVALGILLTGWIRGWLGRRKASDSAEH